MVAQRINAFRKKLTSALTISTLIVGLFAAIPLSLSLPTIANAASTLDANLVDFDFDYSRAENIVGNGKANNDVVVYRNVATVSGVAIDAVIKTTLTGLTASNVTDYDSPGSASSRTDFFQVNKSNATGSMTFNFKFYESGTFTGLNTGNQVVLQNVRIYSIDIDGGDQFTSFSGFQKYRLTSSPSTNLLVSQVGSLVRFISAPNSGSGSAIPEDQVEVEYLTLSSIDIQVGTTGGSVAYFGIGFGAAGWSGATVSTTNNPYNAAPSSTDTTKIVTTGVNTLIAQADFGDYTDPDSNPFDKVQITQLPTSGSLQFYSNSTWSNVTLNQVILISDVNLNKLRLNSSANGTFKFKVNDSAAYSAVANTLTYTVAAQSQTITFANPGTKNRTASPVASGATASSGLTVTLTSSTTGICTVSGLNIVWVADGACTITASQAGDSTYSQATPVTETFYFSSAASQTITFNDPGDKVLTTNPLVIASGASSSSTLTVTLTSFTTTVCTVSGLNISLIATGVCQVRATRLGGTVSSTTYGPASPVERTFNVTTNSTFTLTYTAGTGGTLTGTATQSVSSGANGTAITAVPNTGYQFSSWTDGSTTNPRTDSNVTGNISQQASFTLTSSTYSITYATHNSSTGTLPATVSSLNTNDTATVGSGAGLSYPGFTFGGWSDGTNTYAAGSTYTVASANVVLTAIWTAVAPVYVPPSATITWQTPGKIKYPTALSGVQQNAEGFCQGTAIAGTYIYSPAIGTILRPGTHSIMVTFQPSSGVCTGTSGSVQITVEAPDAPKITWPNPVSVVGPATVSELQLNAVCSIPGKLTYDPAIGKVLQPGAYVLKVTCTPDDSSYPATTATTSFVVEKQTPTIAWNQPKPLIIGIPLTKTQLDSVLSVPGSCVYSPSIGAVLPVGKQKLSVVCTPTNGGLYKTVEASITIDVLPITESSITPIEIAGGKSSTVRLPNAAQGSLIKVLTVGPCLNSATAVGARLTLDPEPTCSGITYVTISSKIDGVITINSIPVIIAVAPVAGIATPITFTEGKISWTKSINAKSYSVTIWGSTVCETTDLNCEVSKTIGPKTPVQVIAHGNDQLSTSSKAAYTNSKPIIVTSVYFDTAKFVVKPGGITEINRVAAIIKKEGFTRLIIEGHTDIKAGIDNQVLSNNRSSATALVFKKLIPKISTKNSGNAFRKPAASNDTPEGMTLNRRAEVLVW